MDILEIENKMKGSIGAMENRFINIRAGRANPAIVSGLNVDYYGVPTPITSIANISVPEARQLFIKPFDRHLLKDIEKSINEANIGLAPTNNGEIVIITIPPLTEDKRREYVKQIKVIGEETKVALRNIRQEANNATKKADLPEDEEKQELDDIQELINKYNKLVDDKMKDKEAELMAI